MVISKLLAFLCSKMTGQRTCLKALVLSWPHMLVSSPALIKSSPSRVLISCHPCLDHPSSPYGDDPSSRVCMLCWENLFFVFRGNRSRISCSLVLCWLSYTGWRRVWLRELDLWSSLMFGANCLCCGGKTFSFFFDEARWECEKCNQTTIVVVLILHIMFSKVWYSSFADMITSWVLRWGGGGGGGKGLYGVFMIIGKCLYIVHILTVQKNALGKSW